MTTHAPHGRRRIASLMMVLATLVAAGAPLWYATHIHWNGVWFAFAASYSAILAGAGALALCRSTGAQLFARSVWWSAFGAGVIAAVFIAEEPDVARVGLAIVLATSTALLAAGRRGLDHGGGEFAPVAYRTPIMISMIMALADAQAVGWLGASRLYAALHYGVGGHEVTQSILLLVCCGVALIALCGLYKLRLWGLVLSAMTTLAIGVLAFTPALGLAKAGPIPYAFAASAAVQVALLAPVFAAIVRRRSPAPASPLVARTASVVPALVILALAALSVATVATSHSLVHF
jgi:hypothetical protein